MFHGEKEENENKLHTGTPSRNEICGHGVCSCGLSAAQWGSPTELAKKPRIAHIKSPPTQLVSHSSPSKYPKGALRKEFTGEAGKEEHQHEQAILPYRENHRQVLRPTRSTLQRLRSKHMAHLENGDRSVEIPHNSRADYFSSVSSQHRPAAKSALASTAFFIQDSGVRLDGAVRRNAQVCREDEKIEGEGNAFHGKIEVNDGKLILQKTEATGILVDIYE
jgi:hypothetical protein